MGGALLCRVWFAKVAESAEGLIRSVLPSDLHAASVEVAPYLIDSVGNSTRIDYGTGHETTFCALLCCLAKLGVLTKDDLQVALGTYVCTIISRTKWQQSQLCHCIDNEYEQDKASSYCGNLRTASSIGKGAVMQMGCQWCAADAFSQAVPMLLCWRRRWLQECSCSTSS